MVSIRDFFQKDGKVFPKAGVSFTAKHWSTFRNSFPAIEEAISSMESRIRSGSVAKQTEPSTGCSVSPDTPEEPSPTEKTDFEPVKSQATREVKHPPIKKRKQNNPVTDSTSPDPSNTQKTPAIPDSQAHIYIERKQANAFYPQKLIPIQPSRLDGRNYHSWKLQMELFLHQLNLYYVIFQTCPSNTDTTSSENHVAAATQKWIDDDYVCRHIILSCLSDSLFQQYSQKTCSAKEIWEELKSVHDEDFGTKRSHINKYVNFQMVDGVSVLEQVHELHKIANSISASGIWIDENFHASVIISKLPPSWKEYRARLMHEEFLPLNMLMHRLQVEEESRCYKKDGHNKRGNVNVVEAGVENNRFWTRKRDGKRVCFSCGKEGHVVKNCPDREKENVYHLQKDAATGENAGGDKLPLAH